MNALSPFSAVYGVVIAARNALYDRETLPARGLQWPVVSVGNIRAGGTGKTPFVIALGKLLQEAGIPFDILSRGYGRNHESQIALVDPNGSPAQFGDEPLLMSQKLGVPVIVGADRHAAGKFAEKMFSETQPAHGNKWIHLLDDGFQHRQLHRDFDIVLISATDAADALLPAGRLRETLSSLTRADAIVLVDAATADNLPLSGQLIWRAKRSLSVSDLPPRPIVFCGVARPERFFAELSASAIAPAATHAFPDHHAYTEDDLRLLMKLRRQNNANGFITTEKDLINLKRIRPELLLQLQPLKAVPMEMVIEDSKLILAAIFQACAIPQQAETINRSHINTQTQL